METIEDVLIRKVYTDERKNRLEVDIFSTNSYGKSSVVTDEPLDDIVDVVLPELIGFSLLEQRPIDAILEEVTEKPEVRFVFSLAVAKAASGFYGLPLYQYVGGIFVKNIPKIVYKDTVYDHEMNPLEETATPTLIPLDTLSSIAREKEHEGDTVRAVEEGVSHLAMGFHIPYLAIESKSEINELLRIHEDLTRMEEI